MTQQIWQPLDDESDGVRSLNPKVGVWVYGKGERISLSTSQMEVFADLPDNLRLCALTPVDEASSVPVEVMEAIRIAMHFVDVAQDWNFNEVEMDDLSVYTCSEVKAKLQSALAWLERTQEAK